MHPICRDLYPGYLFTHVNTTRVFRYPPSAITTFASAKVGMLCGYVDCMITSSARGDFTQGLVKPYSVTLWGSNPDETDNDDCWTGDDFVTREEALCIYREVVMFPDNAKLSRACGPRGSWEYVMIDGPDTHEVYQNPDRLSCARRRRELWRLDAEWQRERATEAGMLHGVGAYNDEMGY